MLVGTSMYFVAFPFSKVTIIVISNFLSLVFNKKDLDMNLQDNSS